LFLQPERAMLHHLLLLCSLETENEQNLELHPEAHSFRAVRVEFCYGVKHLVRFFFLLCFFEAQTEQHAKLGIQTLRL
jgi:hypothetical protein